MSEGEIGSRIFVVDDDTSLCDNLVEILRLRGFDAIGVYTGSDALAEMEKGYFSLVILDVRLPDVDGLEILKRLRTSNSDTGFLMLSGAATLEDAVESLNQGADAFMLKPVDPNDLFARINQVLHLKAVQRRLRESELRYRLIVESSSDSIVALGLNWDVRFVNKSFLHKTGYTWDEVKGRTFASFIQPYDSSLLLRALQDSLKQGGIRLPRFMISRKNGSTINIEASTNVLERDGRPIGVQMMLRDIVEPKQAERDRDLVYRINGITQGECYFYPSQQEALRIFGNLFLQGIPGIIFTKENPENILLKYGLSPDSLRFIGPTLMTGFKTINSLQGLFEETKDLLINHGEPVMVIDGLDSLISENGFEEVYRILGDLRLKCLTSKAVLLVPFDPIILGEREQVLLTNVLKKAQ